MAQGDAGRLEVAHCESNAALVMTEASALLAPQAAARSVVIRQNEPATPVRFVGDDHRVRQVLVNLLGNAVSFTPPGEFVELTAELVRTAPAGTELANGLWCAIRVADRGPGIPAQKLAYVFEPFVQLSADGQPTRKGTGLGLTVSRQLARLMGGDLTAESGDRGAVFTLWLAATATSRGRSASDHLPAP
jgi:signal transduction histidine kinase